MTKKKELTTLEKLINSVFLLTVGGIGGGILAYNLKSNEAAQALVQTLTDADFESVKALGTGIGYLSTASFLAGAPATFYYGFKQLIEYCSS